METAGVAITVDRIAVVVRVIMRGFWTVDTVSQYERQRREALDMLYGSRHTSAQVGMLLDARDFEVESAAVMERLDAIAHLPQDGDLKIAIIQSRKLGKMQAERIASGRYHYFADEFEALAWIDSARRLNSA